MFKEMSFKGLRNRYPKDWKKYEGTLQHELSIIHQLHYENTMLAALDCIQYAKENNISVGPGRGPIVSSLVAYSLGITDIDPVPYGLIFERFLNPKRTRCNDIEIEIETQHSEEVVKYAVSKYGCNTVSKASSYIVTNEPKVVIVEKDDIGTLVHSANVNESAAEYALRFINDETLSQKYEHWKDNSGNIKYMCHQLEPILSETYGCIVYQEQVIKILHDLGEISYEYSDILSRAMTKNKIGLVENCRDTFVRGCSENGIKNSVANAIYDELKNHGKYKYSKAHAVSRVV